MARPRKKEHRGLPPNLVFDKSTRFYRYRRLDTGKYHQMGKDKAKAIAAAKQLNSLIMPGQNLIAGVLGMGITLEQFIKDRYLAALEERQLAEATLQEYSRQFIIINKKLGAMLASEIAVREIADFLSQFTPRMSNKYRNLLSNIFKYVIAEGFRDDNPASSTISRKAIKKRTRLTLEKFRLIYSNAEPWLKNAMDIALMTLQRVNEVAYMRFSDIKKELTNNTEVEFLYVIQKKTKKHGSAAYLKIEISYQLKDIIQRCKDNVLSPYLVHRIPKRIPASEKRSKNRVHHTQITPEQISRAFSAIRDKIGIFDHLPIKERPTFHEIRSLGIILYENAGIDAQTLAGHTTHVMTEQYKQGHDIEWTQAKTNLPIY